MQRMISPEISNWPEEDFRLVGGSCGDCGAAVFPVQDLCPRCSKPSVETVVLPRTGTLITWTTQGFLPGAPYLGDETADTFVPFGVGLVQLGDVIRVEGRLTVNDPEKLTFGMEVAVTTVPLGTDRDGNQVLTFAFQPV
ncbi:Zn-ribbon domain-containing OB-fold protein [Nocardia bovistercoris]|uniref:OB-fold domain-containing protein n=1 Tax=Nocardia bovistercoris TaxID=2785916 RepID=A0A931IDE9_9NOCA|nr:OB-fold domain-containing protein [Nocardia bovistercoris]MBH0778471.1 OB-fold domain-containing protein [Nocardia bovistercoris]